MADALRSAGVPFMVVGSLASTLHGEPRATRNVDIVIDPTAAQLADLLERFGDGTFYVDDAMEALTHRDLFNVIHPGSGWKVDFVIRKDRPFSIAELGRREEVDLLGVGLDVATAEDTVLAKLEWARIGGSERQLSDAASVIAVSGDGLDWDHLRTWAEALGVTDLLDGIVGASRPDG